MKELYWIVAGAWERGGLRFPLEKGEWMCTISDDEPFAFKDVKATKENHLIVLGSLVAPTVSQMGGVHRKYF